MTPSTNPPNGRLVAWCAVVLGVAMSVAANALHVVTVVGPTMGGATVPQIVGAAFWPVALLLSVEVIARVAWPDNWTFNLLRWGGVGAVALVAAIVSYRHMHGLLTHWGEDRITALLGPVGVDGLVTVGAVALMAISHAPTTATPKVPGRLTRWRTSKKESKKDTKPPQATAILATEPTPAPAKPATSEPAVETVGGVDAGVLASLGVPASLQAPVARQLNAVTLTGRAPTAADLAEVGIPSVMASKVIARTVNGRTPAAQS